MRVLRQLTSVEITSSLIYRLQFIIYMISTIVSVTVGLFLWTHLQASGADLPVDDQFIVTYYMMLALVRVAVSTWHSEYLAQVIRDGQLNAWLIRPGSYLLNLIANNIAEKLVKAGAILPMLAVVWVLYRDQFALPLRPELWLLFAIAVVGAGVIHFCLTTAIGSLGFWMSDNAGIARGRHVISMVLSGELVPLALYPAWAMGFLDWQPFRFMLSFPLEVLLGQLSTEALIYGFALQTLWATVFGALCWFAWQRGLQAYNAVGA